jgi:hypothetical protein
MKLETRLKTVLAFSAIAFASAGVAQADEAAVTAVSANAASVTANQHAAVPREVYEGVDTSGRRIKLTISDGGPEALVQIDRQPALPAAHWTSLIGTGGAAAAER